MSTVCMVKQVWTKLNNTVYTYSMYREEGQKLRKYKKINRQINRVFIELVPQLTVTLFEKVTSGKLLRWLKHLSDKSVLV